MGVRGITIQLIEKQKIGADGFGKAIYNSVPVDISDVLIGEPSTEEMVDTLELTGKRLAYTLAIPKEDTHVWENQEVAFWGKTFRVIGVLTQGIDENIPLRWNRKVKVEEII